MPRQEVKSVEFSRPGENGVKPCTVTAGTSIEDAMEQANMDFNEDKEAVFELDKEADEMGDDALDITDEVETGSYVIVPQTESN